MKTSLRVLILFFTLTLCSMQFVPSLIYAATNAQGKTITYMQATTLEPLLINYGDIIGGLSGSGGEERYGMHGDGNTDFNFTNSGNITINFNPSTGDADSFGLYALGVGNHTLNNTGNIKLTSYGEDGEATGIFAQAITGGHILINSGNIYAAATSTASDDSEAYGLYANGSAKSNLSNSGVITAEATSLGNKEAKAYGLYVSYGSGSLLNNTGIINTKATSTSASYSHAFEAFGETSYSVGTWATTLRDWSAQAGGKNADTVFGLNDATGGQINFANTKLIVRPQSTSQGVQLGKTFNVIDMIAITDNAGDISTPTAATVTGSIAEAITEVPFLTATLTNGNNPLTATVRIDSNVDDTTTPGAATAMQHINLAHGQMSNIAGELLQATYEDIYANLTATAGNSGIAAGSESSKNKWIVFFNPYVNFTDNSKYDFDGTSIGITGGASYRVNDAFSFGGHLDFNSAHYSAEILNTSAKSTSFALGLHATYNFTPEWYLRGQLTGAITQTDNNYSINTATGLFADSTYNSEALYLALNTGYVFKFADGHSLTPEIGLSYLNTHTAAYDVKWTGAGVPIGTYDLSYDDSHYSAFYANVALNWRKEWALQNDSGVALLAGLGLRQKLSNDDIRTDMRMLGNRFSTTATEDITSYLADVGIEYRKGNFSISLNYNGIYGFEQTSHGGNVLVKIEF